MIDIRDELSTTISANPFDYDFSEPTLKAFRIWLQSRYPSLAALNAEWETKFAAWDDVRPFTTDQIKNRQASGDAQPQGNPNWQADSGGRHHIFLFDGTWNDDTGVNPADFT